MRPAKIPRLDSITSTSAPSSQTESLTTITEENSADATDTAATSPDVFEEVAQEIPAAAVAPLQAAPIQNSQTTALGTQAEIATQIISSGQGESLQH